MRGADRTQGVPDDEPLPRSGAGGFAIAVDAGWAGSVLGGLLGRLVFGWRYRYSGLFALIVAVAFTALIVYLIDGRRSRAGYGNRSRRW